MSEKDQEFKSLQNPDCQPEAGEFAKKLRAAIVTVALVEQEPNGDIKDEGKVKAALHTLYDTADLIDHLQADLKAKDEEVGRLVRLLLQANLRSQELEALKAGIGSPER